MTRKKCDATVVSIAGLSTETAQVAVEAANNRTWDRLARRMKRRSFLGPLRTSLFAHGRKIWSDTENADAIARQIILATILPRTRFRMVVQDSTGLRESGYVRIDG